MVGEQYPDTWSILRAGVPELLLLILLAAAAGVAGSWLLARRIKKQTHGLEPEQIASLADHREALLHSIREGVLGVGPAGQVTVVNDGARALLDLPADCVGRDVADLGLEPDLLDVLLGSRTGTDAGGGASRPGPGGEPPDRASTGGRSGVASGTVTTLRDRSELIAVQRQLGATSNATDTLRAQTHEFDNQLHVISGLLQLSEYDEARTYVAGLTRRRAEMDSAVTARIEDPPLAALLVAKSSLAAESRVELADLAGHQVPPTAVRAVDRCRHRCRQSGRQRTGRGRQFGAGVDHVEVTVDDTQVHITVSDSGPGVSPETQEQIFDRGFSTKSAAVVGGRGSVSRWSGGSANSAAGRWACTTPTAPSSPPYCRCEPPSDSDRDQTAMRVGAASGAGRRDAREQRGRR